MSQVEIKQFAQQIGIPMERLLGQLEHAGIRGKSADGVLSDEEKRSLLLFLRGGAEKTEAPKRAPLNLKARNKTEIQQTSRTGAGKTVQVEVRKKRRFVKQSSMDQSKLDELARLEAEKKVREEVRNKEAQNRADLEAKRQAEADALKAEEEAKLAAEEAEKRQAEEQEEAKLRTEEEKVRLQQESEEQAKKELAAAERAKNEPAPASKPAPSAAKPAGRGNDRKELHVRRSHRGNVRRPAPRRNRRSVQSSIADQHAFEKPTEPVVRDVVVPETLTVGDLAQKMSVKAAEVIKAMMGMGSMATINQVIDQDTAILVVEEMGHNATAASLDTPESDIVIEDVDVDAVSRAPVVTVMGHVDHGKTSLLDYIRHTKVASGEAGGITQHIGAYRVKTENGDVCFVDTPGHEAFSSMRARGAKVTDIVILVVAGDDGVKPQTIEAIHHAKTAEVPVIVAINKMDKEGADAERVKQELANHEVIPEDWGGDTLMVEVSAHTGQGVDELLESVLLQAEMADLMAVSTGRASGSVVEARMEKGRGAVATVLIQKGELNKGDIVLVGREFGRVRVMLSDTGEQTKSAGPSTPVEIQGLSGVPVAGDELIVVDSERKAREVALHRQGQHKEVRLAKQQKAKLENMFTQMSEGELKPLNLIVKADVQGSVEALTDSLEKLSNDEVRVKVVHGMVGGFNESDVNLALASDAVLVAFNVRADSAARKLIDREGVDIHYYNIIYDVIDDVKSAMTGMLSPELREEFVGYVEVRDVFHVPKIGAIAGCYVKEGEVKRNLPVRVLRDNVVIFDGKIDSLRRFKDDVNEVKAGYECGIGIKNYNDVAPGDLIEVYKVTEKRAEL